jgi:GNAT superfamily N-acetyltransferase
MRIDRLVEPLAEVLRDAVAGGASVGFLRSLGPDEAGAYWRGVFAELSGGGRHLLVARDGADVVGTVQLVPCLKPNGRHRAEVQKLLVRTDRRGRGVGTALMDAVEGLARGLGVRLLVLDTESGCDAERLYRRRGYVLVGEVPDYALSPDGTPRPSAFYYRLLGEQQ